MKKTFIYIAMAAFALSSCSKNEVYDEPSGDGPSNPNKISFNSTTGTTRAVSNDLAALTGSTGFNVLGLKTNPLGGPGGTTTFIPGTDGAGTYKMGTSWGWDGQSYNWPDVQDEYPITFYAEFPKVDMSTNTNLTKDITMNLDMTQQVDLLVAQSIVADKPGNGFAPLNFKHILSNLVFKIQTQKDYKVYIQSIRVVNTAKKGRTFTYLNMGYVGDETVYTYPGDYAITDGTHNAAEGFYYYNNTTTPFAFTGADGATVGEVPTVAQDEIMMQMPQKGIPYWTESNTTDGLGKFKADVKKWKEGNGTVAEKLAAWYAATPATADQPGMSTSDGWKGARIEMIYRIYDDNAKKSIIGRQTGETYTKLDGSTEAAGKDYFIRVGYPLDLSVAPTTDGWEMNKRYTYTIQLGTSGATNGILLDPDYKTIDGESESPKTPVENPAVDPATPANPGVINFNVAVDEWIDNNTDVPVN